MAPAPEICPTCGSRIPAAAQYCAQCSSSRRHPGTEGWRLRAVRLVFSLILFGVLAVLWYRYTHTFVSHFR